MCMGEGCGVVEGKQFCRGGVAKLTSLRVGLFALCISCRINVNLLVPVLSCEII